MTNFPARRPLAALAAWIGLSLIASGPLFSQAPVRTEDGYASDQPVTFLDGQVPEISRIRSSPLLDATQAARDMSVEKLNARFQKHMDEKRGMLRGSLPDLSDAWSTCYSRQGDFRRALAFLLRQGKNAVADKRWGFCWKLQEMLVDASANAKAVLAQRQEKGSKNIVDVVVIGAGVHAAIFNGVATALRPDLRILTIESGDVIAKMFMGSGPAYRINSPELMNASANVIAEAPVQLRDLTEDNLAVSQVLGEVIVYAHYNSHSNFLFNSPVDHVARQGKLYEVTLRDGLKVQAPAVIVATGIGAPDIPGLDDESWSTLYSESNTDFEPATEVPGIQFFEDATRRIRVAWRNQLDPLAPYRGRKVAVVGDGHSGNVFVEFLIGQGFTEIYQNPGESTSEVDVAWVGQKALDFDAFRKRNPHRGVPRYYATLARIYEPGSRVVPVPAHLSSIRLAKEGPHRYEVGVEGLPPVSVDKVVIAAGFRSIALDLTRTVGENVRLDYVDGAVPGYGPSTRLAGQIATGGEANPVLHPIYVLGPAAAPLSKEEELEATITRNRDSINATGPRTEALARQIVPGLEHIPEREQ